MKLRQSKNMTRDTLIYLVEVNKDFELILPKLIAMIKKGRTNRHDMCELIEMVTDKTFDTLKDASKLMNYVLDHKEIPVRVGTYFKVEDVIEKIEMIKLIGVINTVVILCADDMMGKIYSSIADLHSTGTLKETEIIEVRPCTGGRTVNVQSIIMKDAVKSLTGKDEAGRTGKARETGKNKSVCNGKEPIMSGSEKEPVRASSGMMPRTEFISRVRYLGWLCFMMGAGDKPHDVGDDYEISQERLESLMQGTEWALSNPDATAEDNHNNWCKAKQNQGYTYGEVLDVKNKKHPSLVPFAELSRKEQDKDTMDILMTKLTDRLYNMLCETEKAEGAGEVGGVESESVESTTSRQSEIYQNKVNHGFNVTDPFIEVKLLLGEVVELMDGIIKGDKENTLEELADIVIYAYGLASVTGAGDLDTEISRKMEINKNRVYKQNADGSFTKENG